MKNSPFASDSPAGQALSDFWHSLEDDRQARAQLRRADSLTAIVMTPAFHHALHRIAAALGEQGKRLHSDRGRLRFAAIVGALAHVKRHEPLRADYRSTTATIMARRKKETDTPRVSELRFRRLLQVDDMEELYPMLRRTLALIEDAADIHVLATDLWFWGDRQRRQWAYDYYAELPPARRAG